MCVRFIKPRRNTHCTGVFSVVVCCPSRELPEAIQRLPLIRELARRPQNQRHGGEMWLGGAEAAPFFMGFPPYFSIQENLSCPKALTHLFVKFAFFPLPTCYNLNSFWAIVGPLIHAVNGSLLTLGNGDNPWGKIDVSAMHNRRKNLTHGIKKILCRW